MSAILIAEASNGNADCDPEPLPLKQGPNTVFYKWMFPIRKSASQETGHTAGRQYGGGDEPHSFLICLYRGAP